MPDYNLYGLDARTFQQMAQALAIKEIGSGVVVYGDGADGARDATFVGQTNYPSTSSPWNGHILIQMKFHQKYSGDPKKEGEWLKKQLSTEFSKIEKSVEIGVPLDYFLIISNIELTPAPEVGTDSLIRQFLKQKSEQLKLKGFDIWDGNKIRRILDANRDIARAYGGYILSGDILMQMHSFIDGLKPDFHKVIYDFLQVELLADQYARLREAGSAAEKKTHLAPVFVDLPVSEELTAKPTEEYFESTEDINGLELADELISNEEPSISIEEEIDLMVVQESDSEDSRSALMAPPGMRLPAGFIEQILDASSIKLDRKSIIGRQKSDRAVIPSDKANLYDGRFVLIGGPGQGKSTLSQFLCQLYRIALLKERPRESLSQEVVDALDLIIHQCQRDYLSLPRSKRFPIRIELKSLADDLKHGKCLSIIDYIAQRIDKRATRKVDRSDLDNWLENYPWLLILDGLDEVPAAGNRDDVLNQISQLLAQCATNNADIMIIATSRPQGYGDAFDQHLYYHSYLQPLSTRRALYYAKRLVEACHSHDTDLQGDILTRLSRAAANPATERLMRTPLQVTILAVLAEISGDLPNERWELFERYYETIFKRETQRGISLSSILREHRRTIDRIHRHVGLLLQIENEKAGGSNAYLEPLDFSTIVSHYLNAANPDCCNDSSYSIIDKLTEAALTRLVFLVSPREDYIGFEIRSLQEFMAAEALMEGNDSQIRERLAAIAPFAYWRNVFLFCAGKCAAKRDYLIADIVNICLTLGDQSDPIAASTLEGTQLALDLLEDDTFRAAPKQQRALAEIALKLLHLPPSSLHQRLAGTYRPHRQMEAIFENAIRTRLELSSIYLQLSAWSLLLNLVAVGYEWALQLAERYWPQDLQRQRVLLDITAISPVSSAWLMRKAMAMSEMIGPFSLPILSSPLPKIADFIYPDWYKIIALISSSNAEESRIPIHMSGTQGSTLSFRYNSIRGRLSSLLSRLDFPSPQSRSWQIMSAASAFAREPNASVLLTQFKIITELQGGTQTVDLDEWWYDFMPWPLIACLRIAENLKDYSVVIQSIQSGSMGDEQEWLELENSWCLKGIDAEDIVNFSAPLDLKTSYLLFDPSIQYTESAGIIQTYQALTQAYEASKDWTSKKIWSTIILGILRSATVTNQGLSLDVIKQFSSLPSGDQMKEWITLSREYYLTHSTVAALIALADSAGKNSEQSMYMDLLDWFGSSGRYIGTRWNSSLDGILSKISYHFTIHPEKRGLLYWIISLLEAKHQGELPALSALYRSLENTTDRTDLRAKGFTLTLILYRAQPSQQELKTIISEYIKIFRDYEDSPHYSIARSFGLLESRIVQDWFSEFMIELLSKLPEQACLLKVAILDLLRATLTKRKSTLHDKVESARLGLWLEKI